MKFAKITAGLCAGALAFCGIAGSMPVHESLTASAAENEITALGLKYIIEKDHVVISGFISDELPAELKIPAEIEGLPVTIIGEDAFYNCAVLTGVTIPDSVTTISRFAFDDCSNLTSITFSDSLTRIDQSAFAGCASLTSITLPDDIEEIGTRAFWNCTALTSITIPESVTQIGASTFAFTPWINAKREESPFVVVNNILIDGKTCVGDITIPNNVVSIVSSAFFGDENLTGITVPDSVTSISECAFSGCPNLISVTIPDSVTTIKYSILSSCPNLTNITLPKNLTSITENMFALCTRLTSITIPDSVTNIESGAFFDCSSLKDITLPSGVTNIGESAFCNCRSLTRFTIPDSVTNIEDLTFYGCKSLAEITIPDSVSSIGSRAFDSCINLKDLTIKNPDCVISDDSIRMHTKGVIHGYANSTAQTYAENNGYAFELIDDTFSEPFPDMNNDGMITASDAQTVLIAYADILAGNEPDLTPEQFAAADVDSNNEITALDAQYTLTYYLFNTVLAQPTTWEEILYPNGE